MIACSELVGWRSDATNDRFHENNNDGTDRRGDRSILSTCVADLELEASPGGVAGDIRDENKSLEDDRSFERVEEAKALPGVDELVTRLIKAIERLEMVRLRYSNALGGSWGEMKLPIAEMTHKSPKKFMDLKLLK